MVDNILREGQEVGFSSGDDGDLSGDEIHTPLFVIKTEAATDAVVDEGGDDYGDEDGDIFVQEEYDLANNVDQMITRLSQFDEYSHLREKVT